MNKVKKFDRESLTLIRQDINKLLRVIEIRRGIKINIGNIRFVEDSFTTRMEAKIIDPKATPEEQQRKEFAKLAYKVGLKEIHYGLPLRANDGGFYKLIGIMPRKRKYPLLGINERTGKKLCFNKHALILIPKELEEK